MTEPTPPQRPVGPYEQSLIESRSSRKALENRVAAERRRKIVAAVLGVVLVLGAGVGGFVWWAGRADSAPTATGPTTDKCSSLTPVKLWVTSAMQSAAVALTQAYEASPSSPCIDYTVETRNPIESMIGLGQGQPNRPDGWIADSPRWLERVNATTKINAKPATSFAQSPLVIAMDPARAATLTAQPQWLELIASDQPIRLSDPRSTTAGMLTLAAALPQLSKEQGRVVIPKLAKQAAPSTDDLFAAYETKPEDAPAFPVSEADLIEHNRVSPEHRMVSVTPAEGTPPFEYALINVATDPVKADGVESIRTYLKTPEAARILARYGLRSTTSPVPMPTPKGSLGEVKIGPSPSPEQVAAATDVWQSATTDFSLLAVFDVSGSMKEKVGKSTRVAITQEAAGIALQALPATTKLGLWVFSTNIGPGGADYREIAPIAELDPAHKQVVAAAASRLSQSVGGGTGLYDTIWAAYQRASASYDPDRVNAVVVLTDGRNDDTAGLTLDQLKANLRKAANPDKPIAITTIGIGPDVDPKVLSEISKMTFSDFYAAPSPADMTTVLARALFDHDCKNGRCV